MVDLPRLLLLGERACASADWGLLGTVAAEVAPLLGPRVGLLARQVVFLVEDGENQLACSVWAHVAEAARLQLELDAKHV